MPKEMPLDVVRVSRRATFGAALAAVVFGRFGGHRLAGAQENSTDTWNFRGNAGHTGELPGPGLDLDGALGELWRIPREEFSSGYQGEVVGYLNDVLYTINGDSLWARRLSDGEFLWAQSPLGIAATPTAAASPAAEATPSAEASPAAGVDAPYFYSNIAIDGPRVLVSVSNRQLWCLDEATGQIQWTTDSGSPFSIADFPTVVDHVAFLTMTDGNGYRVVAIEIEDEPAQRWAYDGQFYVIGCHDGYLYVSDYGSPAFEIRALSMDDGSEYWRATVDGYGEYRSVHGVGSGGIYLEMMNSPLDIYSLIQVSLDGLVSQVATLGSYDNGVGIRYFGWYTGETVLSLTAAMEDYGSHHLGMRYPESGNLGWEIAVDASRWTSVSSYPVVCDGIAHALLRDNWSDRRILITVDVAAGTVRGQWGSVYEPLFVADGTLVAQDHETDEIVAIGGVSPVLQAGGRATVTEDIILRGAPSDSAIERGELVSGTVVEVTGQAEVASGTEWLPVTVSDTGERGWLPATVLLGQDGAIRFEPIDPWEFGELVVYPKFAAGTSAEITEPTILRGAPSDTSAEKATLDTGTLVTVTSPPTESEEGEWCPIEVDETRERGWVPVDVLRLAPGA